MSTVIEKTALDEWLDEHTDWALDEKPDAQRIKGMFKFSSFKQAIRFVIAMAGEMEDMHHHAEIYNIYNRVELTLTTHDAGNKVTEKDLNLAGKASAIMKGVKGEV